MADKKKKKPRGLPKQKDQKRTKAGKKAAETAFARGHKKRAVPKQGSVDHFTRIPKSLRPPKARDIASLYAVPPGMRSLEDELNLAHFHARLLKIAPDGAPTPDPFHPLANHGLSPQKGTGHIPHGETSDDRVRARAAGIGRERRKTNRDRVSSTAGQPPEGTEVVIDPRQTKAEKKAAKEKVIRNVERQEAAAIDAYGPLVERYYNSPQFAQTPPAARIAAAHQMASMKVYADYPGARSSQTEADRSLSPKVLRGIGQLSDVIVRGENDEDFFGDSATGKRGSREDAPMNLRGTLKSRQIMPEGQTISSMLHPHDVTSPDYGNTLQGLSATETAWLQQNNLLDENRHPVGKRGVAYLNAREKTNSSPEETLAWIDSGMHAHKKFKTTKAASFGRRGSAQRVSEAAKAHVEKSTRGPEETEGVKDKYGTVDPRSHEDFRYAMRGAGVPTLEDLRKTYDNATDKELLAFRQEARETIQNHMSDQKAAYETRQARVKGLGAGHNNEQRDDRVVVFTTNLGYPTASIASDSLVGQYIIHKRKQMVVKDKHTTKDRKDVKGKFPMAVRDQHLIEGGIGVSAGVEGRGGLFQETGWKVMSHRSKGYANKVPLGAQVLRDKSGLPIYDKHGNVRYTEGYTKRFSAGTDNQVGVRFFVG